MKKIIAVLFCLNMALSPVYSFKIEDDFINQTLDKNLKIKTHRYYPLVDSFAQSNTNKNPARKTVIFDEVLPEMPKQKFVRKPVIFDENYKEIKVRIKNFYTTKSKIQEGETIEFVTLNDVTIKNKNYPKNSTVKARVEMTSLNKSYGIPADVIVGNFKLDDTLLTGEISKTGANRILWLRPTVYVTTMFFGIGILLIPIRGGHAKIKPSQIYTLYAIE